jgi:hypothetical protein
MLERVRPAMGSFRRPALTAPPLPVSSPASPESGSTPAEQPRFEVGETVRLSQRPAFLKSADPMPMLRPPDLIDEGETGVVVELRTLEQRAVRFRRGTFLLTVSQLRCADESEAS